MRGRLVVIVAPLLAGALIALYVMSGERARGAEARPAAGSRVERSFPALGIRQVKASVKVGKLQVVADDGDTIRVRTVRIISERMSKEDRRWAEQARVEIERQGDAVVVNDIVPERRGRSGKRDAHPRLEVEIELPPGRVVRGAIGVGDVEAAGRIDSLALESGVGHIRVRQLECTGEHVRLRTGVGDVSLGLRSLPERNVKVDVGVGSASIRLPAGGRANLNTQTGVGRIRTTLPVKRAARGPFNPGESMVAALNGGGVPVGIHVGVGDVRLGREE